MSNLKNIFHNCLDVIVENEIYFPVRFTDKLFRFYESTGVAQFPERAVQTAGITMEFCTSQEEIGFTFFFTCFARDWITFDVYENDIFMETVHFEDRSLKARFRYKKRNAGETRIIIYMPATADTHFTDFDLGDYHPVQAPARKYLALGCSITQGMEAVSPSITYANIVKRHYNTQILNLGIGGFYYDPDSLDEELPYDPDIITVAYGTNDAAGSASVGEISTKTSGYLEKLRSIYPGKTVHVITPVWRKEWDDDPSFIKKASEIQDMIVKESSRQQFHVIDGRPAIPHSPAFYKDGFLHPNDLGFALYGLYVIKNMKVDQVTS